MIENHQIEPLQGRTLAPPWEYMSYDSKKDMKPTQSTSGPRNIKHKHFPGYFDHQGCDEKLRDKSSALTEWDRLAVQHHFLRGLKGVKSISECTLHGVKIPGENSVDVKVYKNGRVKVRGCVKRCKTLDCASCGPYMRAKEAQQITMVGEECFRRGGSVCFAGFTHSQHYDVEKCVKGTLAGIKFMNRFVTDWNNNRRRAGKEDQMVGLIVVMEGTFTNHPAKGEDYWTRAIHHHAHPCLFLPKGFREWKKLKEGMEAAWVRGVESEGCYTLEGPLKKRAMFWNEHQGIEGLGSYIAKTIERVQEESRGSKRAATKMGLELTQTSTKKNKGRSLEELAIDIAVDGSSEDIRLYTEYFRSIAGKQRFRKNKVFWKLHREATIQLCKTKEEEERRELELASNYFERMGYGNIKSFSKVWELYENHLVGAQKVDEEAKRDDGLVNIFRMSVDVWGIIGGAGKTTTIIKVIREWSLKGRYQRLIDKLRGFCKVEWESHSGSAYVNDRSVGEVESKRSYAKRGLVLDKFFRSLKLEDWDDGVMKRNVEAYSYVPNWTALPQEERVEHYIDVLVSDDPYSSLFGVLSQAHRCVI